MGLSDNERHSRYRGDLHKRAKGQDLRDREISLMIGDTAKDFLSKLNDDERVAWFSELPKNTQQQYISLYIPKQKDADADLVESHLSLTRSFANLPGLDDLMGKCRELRLANKRLRMEVEAKEYLYEEVIRLSRRKPFNQLRKNFVSLFEKLWEQTESYMSEQRKSPVDLEKVREWADGLRPKQKSDVE